MGISFSGSSNGAAEQYGYHILRVQQNSPAQQAGLEPFFDFILAINGNPVTSDRHLLHRELDPSPSASDADRPPVELLVFNSRLGARRRLVLSPGTGWGGQGRLGASVRFCSLAGRPALALRVLDVAAFSPASAAGLRSGTDFIVGAESPLEGPEDLCDLLESGAGRPVHLLVYCCLGGTCRQVAVTPDPGWGGPGCLGCTIGCGYLHRIPDSVGDQLGQQSAADLQEPSQQSTNLPTASDKKPTGRASVSVV